MESSLGLAEFYLTANYSTTTGRISILFAVHYWARRQLSNAVRYVSVASKLRNSLSSVVGVPGGGLWRHVPVEDHDLSDVFKIE